MAGQITLNEGTAPGTPASGNSTFYVKTDGNLYQKDDTGTETLFASASSVVGRNKIINGTMVIDQRNSSAAQTITAAAALAYTVDRWYGYCTGANVTGQQVAGTAPNQYNYRYTGAASVTKIAHAQRIEAANCQDLAGATATIAVDLANSLLTTVTWTAWRATTTNDTFGTLAAPTRTQIGTGTFTVTSTLARYTAQITVTAASTTGIEIEFSVAAQTSGTWTIGRVQLEAGSTATSFEHRQIGVELALCQRYYLAMSIVVGTTMSDGGNQAQWTWVQMRTVPTLVLSTSTGGSVTASGATGARAETNATSFGGATIFASAEL